MNSRYPVVVRCQHVVFFKVAGHKSHGDPIPAAVLVSPRKQCVNCKVLKWMLRINCFWGRWNTEASTKAGENLGLRSPNGPCARNLHEVAASFDKKHHKTQKSSLPFSNGSYLSQYASIKPSGSKASRGLDSNVDVYDWFSHFSVTIQI